MRHSKTEAIVHTYMARISWCVFAALQLGLLDDEIPDHFTCCQHAPGA